MYWTEHGSVEEDATICAFSEIANQRWDVVGRTREQERAVRRRAREIAAAATRLPEEET